MFNFFSITPTLQCREYIRQRLRDGENSKRDGRCQVNILENSNWVKSYGENYRTFSGRCFTPMLPSLWPMFTMYDTIGKWYAHAFLIISSDKVNLAIQPTVSGSGQKGRRKVAPRSFKRKKASAGATPVTSGQWVVPSPWREPHVAITEGKECSLTHPKARQSLAPTPRHSGWNPGPLSAFSLT